LLQIYASVDQGHKANIFADLKLLKPNQVELEVQQIGAKRMMFLKNCRKSYRSFDRLEIKMKQ